MNTTNKDQDPISQMLDIAQSITGWTRDETRKLISSIRSSDKERLLDDISNILEWCRAVEMKQAMVDVLKTMPAGIMEVQWMDGDVAMRFRPDLDIQMIEDESGTKVTIKGD